MTVYAVVRVVLIWYRNFDGMLTLNRSCFRGSKNYLLNINIPTVSSKNLKINQISAISTRPYRSFPFAFHPHFSRLSPKHKIESNICVNTMRERVRKIVRAMHTISTSRFFYLLFTSPICPASTSIIHKWEPRLVCIVFVDLSTASETRSPFLEFLMNNREARERLNFVGTCCH